jgi:hypothetical protein
MSHHSNDLLYDRMADLLPYLTPMVAEELDGYIKSGDLTSAHHLLKVIEAKCVHCTNPAHLNNLCYPHWVATQPQLIRNMDLKHEVTS